ncbi:hypothetical protein AVEN_178203-1 [Araneus ventricosus]|uniref:Uncharacterized protein n=1 Tax=Araneus ventricosus TaxID=182803 RepID=A0A4Y2H4B1_ARAVE|nr:hypothetical protein AVEN_178203-1 [Araneus ventricosus]
MQTKLPSYIFLRSVGYNDCEETSVFVFGFHLEEQTVIAIASKRESLNLIKKLGEFQEQTSIVQVRNTLASSVYKYRAGNLLISNFETDPLIVNYNSVLEVKNRYGLHCFPFVSLPCFGCAYISSDMPV